jgi:predicted aspartyl protease
VEIRIPSISSENADNLILTVQIAGRKYEFLVDSGASISVIKTNLVSGRTEQVDYTVRGVTGENLEVLGSKEI